MAVYRALTRHVLAPSFDLLRGTHTMRSLRELEESQWWPLQRIEALLEQSITHLLGILAERNADVVVGGMKDADGH